ncbi:MAG: tyrosine-protein phosphatase [Trichloromonadaceae bacterium]
MIDWHCHLLPGIDDGAPDLEESLAMARSLVAAGYRQVCCTPHCMHGVYGNNRQSVQQAVAALQLELNAAGIPLKLLAGMEYYLDEFFPEQLANSLPLGSTRLLLVEIPSRAHLEVVRENIFRIVRKGLIPLLAHPERIAALVWQDAKPAAGFWSRLAGSFAGSQPPAPAFDLRDLRALGCQFQGNLGSLGGYYGAEVKARAQSLLQAGFYQRFGTDGHHRRGLAQILSAGAPPVQAEE